MSFSLEDPCTFDFYLGFRRKQKGIRRNSRVVEFGLTQSRTHFPSKPLQFDNKLVFTVHPTPRFPSFSPRHPCISTRFGRKEGSVVPSGRYGKVIIKSVTKGLTTGIWQSPNPLVKAPKVARNNFTPPTTPDPSHLVFHCLPKRPSLSFITKDFEN